MDNNWFKVWPSKLRSLVSSLVTGRQRANMTLLIVTYLDEGGLPDSDARLSFLTGLPIEDIQELRPYFEFLGRCEGGRLYIDFAEDVIMERVEFAEKKANAGAKRWAGGESKAKQRELEDSTAKTPQALQSTPKRPRAQLSTAKHSSAQLNTVKPNIQTDIHTNNISDSANALSGADAPEKPPPGRDSGLEPGPEESHPAGKPEPEESPPRRKPDPLFQIFCEMFVAFHDDEPYAYKPADFVKLAALRARYAKAKPDPWEVTPERFKRAAGHYFESVIATHTLADLCERFSTFFTSPINEFNKPIKRRSNGKLDTTGSSPQPTTEELGIRSPRQI